MQRRYLSGLATIAICLMLSSWLVPSYACSFVQPTPVSFDPSLARPGDQPPASPEVSVKSIRRGSGEDRTSCADTGVVVLAIPATAESRELAYSFEMISGRADDVIFQPGPSSGFEQNGALLFYFPWLDGASNTQEPLDLVVQVTPFRQSGLRGNPAAVSVVHAGHSLDQTIVDEYQLYNDPAQAAFASLIAVVVLWRRQARQRVALGFVRWAGVYFVVLVVTLTCIVALTTLSSAVGFQNGRWLMQVLWLVSILIGYFLGGQAVARLRPA